MGGVVDWTALPIITEMLGVTDPDDFVRQLLEVRGFYHGKSN